ncbi:MAG: TlpA family protein disulfide reductase [Thermoplasmatota archaeon]
MGKSYSEKMRARNARGSDRPRPEKKPKKEAERKEKFPLAPVVVIVVILILIISTVVLYRIQNDDGGDGGGPDGNNDDPGNDVNIEPYATISLESTDSGIINLHQYRGKVIVIDMFATWCPPCKEQMGELIDIQSRFSSSDVVIISIDTDLTETLSQVRDFKEDYPAAKWTFARSNLDFNTFFPASSIPTLYILDREGRRAGTHVGLTSADNLAFEINQLI